MKATLLNIYVLIMLVKTKLSKTTLNLKVSDLFLSLLHQTLLNRMVLLNALLQLSTTAVVLCSSLLDFQSNSVPISGLNVLTLLLLLMSSLLKMVKTHLLNYSMETNVKLTTRNIYILLENLPTLPTVLPSNLNFLIEEPK